MMQFVPSQWDNISFQQLQKYAHSQVCYFKMTQSSNSIKLNILRFSASAHIFFQSSRSAPEEVAQIRTEWRNPRFQHLNRKQVSLPRAEHFDLQTQNLAEKSALETRVWDARLQICEKLIWFRFYLICTRLGAAKIFHSNEHWTEGN